MKNKYSIGEYVFYIKEYKVEKERIIGIIYLSDDDQCAYCFDVYPINKSIWVLEEDIFKTKEELIASL